MLGWMSDNEAFLAWMFVLSILMFFGTLLVLPIMIVRMPSDYFMHRERPPDIWSGRHPAIRWTVLTVRNFVGLLLIVAGCIMIITPGQGILAILVGLSMMSLPGKRQLELRLVRSRPVLKAINWVRAKNHRPPLQLPDRRAT